MVNATQKRPGVFWENAVFYLSLILLAATVGSFFYVRYLAVQSGAELAGFLEQAAKTKTDEQKRLEAGVLAAQRKIGDYSKVVAERKSAVNFFGGIERLITRNVYFSSCNLDLDKMAANWSGHGRSFQDVGRQIMKFGAAADILEGAYLGKVTESDAGGVDFDANIILKPEMVVFK
jgi:hypothetical protein